MLNAIATMHAGLRCTSKARIVSLKLRLLLKTSKEKRLKKSTKRMQRIRGAQKSSRFTFAFISSLPSIVHSGGLKRGCGPTPSEINACQRIL